MSKRDKAEKVSTCILTGVGMMGFAQVNTPEHLLSPSSVNTQTTQWLVKDEPDLILTLSSRAMAGEIVCINYHHKLFAGSIISVTPSTQFEGHLVLVQSTTGVQYLN